MIVLRNVSCNLKYWRDPVAIATGRYANGRLAIELLHNEDFTPIAKVTANMVDEPCPEGEVWVKDWSENEGMLGFLTGAGIIEPSATQVTTTGYANVKRFRLTAKFLTALRKAEETQS